MGVDDQVILVVFLSSAKTRFPFTFFLPGPPCGGGPHFFRFVFFTLVVMVTELLFEYQKSRTFSCPVGRRCHVGTVLTPGAAYSVAVLTSVVVALSVMGAPAASAAPGDTWTSRTAAVDSVWNSVTYGGSLFVAVSQFGTGNRVMTSGTSSTSPGTSSTLGPVAPAQQVGLPATGSCTDVDASQITWGASILGGWKQSWAWWANNGAGGPVCTRDLVYNTSTGTWSPA